MNYIDIDIDMGNSINGGIPKSSILDWDFPL
jgi:hypothetical protein